MTNLIDERICDHLGEQQEAVSHDKTNRAGDETREVKKPLDSRIFSPYLVILVSEVQEIQIRGLNGAT
ncbi:hypothetical protein E2C01_064798 [Portunus trituberculatus]|uniref:Uncharacterized protein n=1 Tax=Portunus trituberculatus TaxID=210409 RepID=A0A5B7HMV4_PORTR|nr:hypothetical protein [Portunus trituberculatus]